MRRITKTGLLAITFLALSLSALSAIHFSIDEFKIAKADDSQYLGEVSITGVRHYDPYWQNGANLNQHFIMQLGGSDYPASSTDQIKYVSKSYLDPVFTDNISTHLQFTNRNGGSVSITTYWEAYYCQESTPYAFSFGLIGFGDSASAMIKKGLKIPSYAMMKGDTSSPTYGYYTVDKNYSAKLINTAPRSSGVRDWTVEEYNPRNVTVNGVYSYVDGNNEFLTFNLDGVALDYPTEVDDPGNHHFNFSQVNTLLPNFTSKIHFYDANNQVMTYSLANLCSINLWDINPRFSVGIDILRNARKVLIESGLILPSYARYQGTTSSEVYDGYIVTNELFLTIDENASHTTGAQIPWTEQIDEIGTVTLSLFKTNHPFSNTNTNEFFIFQFNETTDFATAGRNIHWDSNRVSLLDNFASNFEIYDSSNTKMDAKIITTEVIFNYMFENEIAIMIEGGKNAVRAVLREGLHFPTYALHNNEKGSQDYGYYALARTYELDIQTGHTHTQGSTNDWPLPYCPVEFYDESDVIISSLSTTLVPGASYTLPESTIREGYINNWQLITPTDLVVENNSFVAPLQEVTIKFKEHYEKIPTCSIEYYSEEGKLLSDYSVTLMCNTEYVLEPITSKRGHDGSWVVLEPEGIEVINNKIITPSYETTIKFKAHYEARTYQISFEGVETAPISVKYGEKIGVLPEIPEIVSKTGLWVIDEIVITPDTVFEFDENKVATIMYVDRICKIDFVSDGGNEVDPIELVYGTVVDELPIPEREGYFFDGWYFTNGEKYEAGQELVDDLTLYAHWLVKCTVVFDTDGGSLIQTVIIGEGQLLAKPTDPTKEGCEFLYWTVNGKEFDFNTPVTGDMTLVAKWKEVSKPVEPQTEKPKVDGGVIALIVGSSVLAVAGIGLLAFLIIRKKKMR